MPRNSRFPLGDAVVPPPVDGDIRFFDDFESARMDSVTTLALPGNLDGFTWSSNNRTSLVRNEWDLNPSGGRRVWASNAAQNDFFLGEDWRTISGRHSLRFRYEANHEMSEQRFLTNTPYREIWVRYWIRVPLNFNLNPNGTNNKWFVLWADSYSDGSSCLWEFRPQTSGGNAIGAYTYIHLTEPGIGLTGAQKPVLNFIRIPEDRGRWMQVVYQSTFSSTSGASDGVCRLWRRWDNEPSFTLLHEITNARFHPLNGGSNGFTHGYIMGWANNPYSVTTEFLVDDFTVSTTSLLLA